MRWIPKDVTNTQLENAYNVYIYTVINVYLLALRNKNPKLYAALRI